MDVYMPAEDSELLAESVYKHASGDILEVGTGSGYVARVASLVGKNVLAVDINPAALAYAREHNSKPNLEFRESDMFETVTEKFDWIVTNPPYLPHEPRAPDIALDGGPEGWEWIARFLSTVHAHLKPDGNILLLFSTLSKQEMVESLITQNGFESECVNEEKLFGEVLYVYKLSRTH